MSLLRLPSFARPPRFVRKVREENLRSLFSKWKKKRNLRGLIPTALGTSHGERLRDAKRGETPTCGDWLIIFRKMFQGSVSTFSRMRCSHVGVSDHGATLSVPRCQVIDLYTGALTDLRCIAKCKCKSSLFRTRSPFISLFSSSLFPFLSLVYRDTTESDLEIKARETERRRKQRNMKRRPDRLLYLFIVLATRLAD